MALTLNEKFPRNAFLLQYRDLIIITGLKKQTLYNMVTRGELRKGKYGFSINHVIEFFELQEHYEDIVRDLLEGRAND